MKTFKDLVFTTRDDSFGGRMSKLFFGNGYGVSVIQGGGAYTSGDTYELAVLKGSEDGWGLCYDTPITDDVLGHQSKTDITAAMAKVQAL